MPPIFLELYQHGQVWDSPWSFLYISLINSLTTGSRLDAEKHNHLTHQNHDQHCPIFDHYYSIALSSRQSLYGKLQPENIMNATLKCILCVEDEPEMIDLIRLILGRRGFDVKGANGGVEGLKMIHEETPDLILLDLMMPDMDGWEVYQQIKADEKTKNIPVIVVTAKAQSIDKVLGLHIAKVDDYIAKPFNPQELLASVERVLQK